ncbi:MAG: dipeptide epimerase, partial [Pseudomonadota bacterium]
MTKFSVIERSFRFKTPFVISGHVFKTSDVVQVTVKEDGFIGHGEASGVYFTGETTATIKAQIEAYLGNAANPLSFDRLNAELPSGGARNALDCALWDLECKRRNTRIWDLVNVNVRELQTVMTVGLDSPDNMGRAAAKAGPAKILKLKLGPDDPIGCTRVVREQRPDVDLIVDINQG